MVINAPRLEIIEEIAVFWGLECSWRALAVKVPQTPLQPVVLTIEKTGTVVRVPGL